MTYISDNFNIKDTILANLNYLKRKLIGGIWIKNKTEGKFTYCTDSQNGWLSSFDHTKRVYSGFGRTNVGIETLEDYGSVTPLGNFLGYSNHSPIIQKSKLFSLIDMNQVFMFSLFLIVVISSLANNECNFY